ncbi:MAG: selenium metabolism-associated LysR family transcriptional regulator [Dehalococcoidales bacterium]|nr:selenium metabolism-associated LysR family transcriptional regulator [Dehalococcoidales bacterium]
MNLDYLKTYLEVIKLGSFSEVAKKLSISQPAVSFQIQKLEHDLGVRLLDRSQKAITVTEAGKRFLRFAEAVEEARDHLRHDLDQLREEVRGNLVAAASTIPGEFLLPQLLAEFRLLYPAAVSARLVVSDSLCVVTGVRDGTYEVGFCGIAPDVHDLEFFKIARDSIVLIVSPGHPFAERKEVSLADLEGEPFISREETSGTQRSLQTCLSRAGLDLRKWMPNLVLGTTQAVVSAVETGVGIAFVSNLAIKKSLALGLVKEVAVGGLRLNRDFFCVYRKERVTSRLLEKFIAFIQARALPL